MSAKTPRLHLVPNGVHGTLKRGGHTLRLQLLLLPDRDQEFSGDDAAPWSRTKWPSQAHAWFDKFIAGRPEVTLDDEHGGAPVASGKIRTALPPLAPEHYGHLDTLWNRALDGREGITAFFKAATTSDPDHCVRAAIPTPTLEASLLLPLERARAALERVGGPHGALASRAPARPAMHLLSSVGRPWLGTAGRGVQLASAGADVLDPSVARLLLGPPDVADWLENGGAGRIDETHPYDRLLDPEAITAAAIGHGEEDLLWLSDRLHALHHASLNLVVGNDQLPEGTDAAGRRLHQLLASPALMRLFGWVRDVLLEIEAPLPAGERAIYCSIAAEPSGPTPQPVAAVLEIEGDGFFPATPTDWRRLAPSVGDGTKSPEPWAQRGMRVLAPGRICVGSVEPTLCTEADHQCQTQKRATRLVTGPLSLYEVGKVKADACKPDGKLLFATDLATPPRLYIGVDEQGRQTRWWPTSTRTLGLFDPWSTDHDKGWPNDALHALTPHWLPPWERDASSVTDATTYQCEKGQDGKSLCPCQDPRLAAYHGDDLGAPPNELTPPDSGKPIRWQEGEVKLSRECDLFIDQRLAAAPDTELAPLIFGLHYRVALAERSLGGGGPSFDHVLKALARSDSTAVWPPHDRPGYRYLRHEPIAKPVVLLAPETEQGNALEHKLQTSERMVLVHATAPHENDARSLARTSRILLVPAVACAFAARHDVFDDEVEHTAIRVLQTEKDDNGKEDKATGDKEKHPKQVWTTVPVTMPRQGLRDAVIENEGAMVPDSVGVKPAARIRLRGSAEEVEIRQSPYYPDPAAALVVLRLAHPDTGAWLEEPPLVLRLRETIESKGPTGWPDVLPVRIDLVAADKTAPSRLDDGGWWEALGAATSDHAGSTPPRVPMRVATVTLAPGEAIKLHAWFVPEAADLTAWFDAVEQAAALAHAEGKANGAAAAKAAAEGLKVLLGDCVCANERAVDAVAEAFHAHMLIQPLPEIADTLELDCIYASDVPTLAPTFLAGTIGLARPSKLEPSELARFLGESGRASEWGNGLAAADNATALVPGGIIAFDPATTSQLIVEVEMVAPGRETLDVEPQALPPQLAPLAQSPLPFRLADDGTAFFGCPGEPQPPSTPQNAAPISPRWVELMQINNIPFPADARTKRREMLLEDVVAGISVDFAGATVVSLAALEQTQARRARLRLRALPRHTALITGKARKPSASSTYRSAKVGPASDTLWAPATARPAPVVTKDFEPTFDWSPLVRRPYGRGLAIAGERVAGLRLWLRRPWFTSGEGERLAIILWPPAAFAQIDGETAAYLPDDLSLQGLHEDDLGPLGRFVSVWGFDPLGAGPPRQDAVGSASTKRWSSAFLNRTHIQLGSEARFHPHLLMPVPGQVAPESLDTPRETMAAVAALSVPVCFQEEVSSPISSGEAYVDVSLQLPYQADVLFRLGLARLQENARPDTRGVAQQGTRAGIRLSAPASIQGYVPPPRRFNVTVTPNDARSGAVRLVSLVAVTLAGPSAANRPNPDTRRVKMALRERRGPDEVPVSDEDGNDATLVWAEGESHPGIEHLLFGDEESWTGMFRIPGDVLHEERDIVVFIDEEDWLPNSSGSKPSLARPRFTVSITLQEN